MIVVSGLRAILSDNFGRAGWQREARNVGGRLQRAAVLALVTVAVAASDKPPATERVSNPACQEAQSVERTLQDAAFDGCLKQVNELIGSGADIDFQRADGATALILATENVHEAVVHALLDAGADVNAQANDGGTAVFMASQEGQELMLRALLDAGADVNARVNNGATAVFMASQNGHATVVRALIDAGAAIDVRANNGVTALMMASHEGHESVVRVLIDMGADVDLQVHTGETALSVASTDTIGRMLRDAGTTE